jgi:predicted ATP-dependent protease
VIIPVSNVKHLMLKEDVVEAVSQGKFHIYPVSTIDEGIEILTGVKAGKRLKNGSFQADSINDRVQRRLITLAKKIRDFGKDEEKPEKSRDTNNNSEAKESKPKKS